jgi:hypothetical protein
MSGDQDREVKRHPAKAIPRTRKTTPAVISITLPAVMQNVASADGMFTSRSQLNATTDPHFSHAEKPGFPSAGLSVAPRQIGQTGCEGMNRAYED